MSKKLKKIRLYKYQIVEIRPKEYTFDLGRSLDTGKIKEMTKEMLMEVCKESFKEMYPYLNKVVKSAEIKGSELKVTIE